MRMAPDDPARKVLLGCPKGQRRRDRAKLRWKDGVDEAARLTGIRNLTTVASDRERFRMKLRQAKTDQSVDQIVRLLFSKG